MVLRRALWIKSFCKCVLEGKCGRSGARSAPMITAHKPLVNMAYCYETIPGQEVKNNMRKIERILLSALISINMFVLIGVNDHDQAQKACAATATTPIAQQPLFSEYKGIRLGMTAEQVRTQLGTPTIKGDDQDYYVISATE